MKIQEKDIRALLLGIALAMGMLSCSEPSQADEVQLSKIVNINCEYVGGQAEIAADMVRSGRTFSDFMLSYDTQPDIAGSNPHFENHARLMTEHAGKLIFSPELHDTIMSITSEDVRRRTTRTCHGDPAGFFANYL